jgi:outer membrane protein TolC
MLLAGAAEAEPLSLEDCIDLALQNNPGLALSRQQLAAAKGDHLSSYSAFLPTVSLDGGLRQTESAGEAVVFQGTTFRQSDFSESFSLSASASQNLINLPSWFSYQASKSDVDAARQTLRVSETDLVYLVRQQYFLVSGAIRLQRVATDALEVSEEQLRKSEALYELGSVARTDVLQARVNRATSVQEEISARNSVDQERANLAVLMGMGVDEPLEIQVDVEDPPQIDLDEGSLVREALELRPELRRAGAQLQAAQQRNRSAFWSQFPSLNGSLFWSRQTQAYRPEQFLFNEEGEVIGSLPAEKRRGPALRELLDFGDLEDDASWGFSIGLNWRIFDGLGTIGNVRSAKASLAGSKEEQRRQELDAALQVREAVVAIRNAQEGIRAAEESVELAAENLKLQQALYENGGGTILELNNAQVENTRARNSLIEAQIGLHLAYALLDRAIGR